MATKQFLTLAFRASGIMQAATITSGFYDLRTNGLYNGNFNITLSDRYRLSGYGFYDVISGGQYPTSRKPVNILTPTDLRLNNSGAPSQPLYNGFIFASATTISPTFTSASQSFHTALLAAAAETQLEVSKKWEERLRKHEAEEAARRAS